MAKQAQASTKAGKTPPAPAKRKGRAFQPALRWSLTRAAKEFGFQRTELETRRRAAHILPGDDQCFATQQICAMCFGDKRLADTKRAEAEAAAAIRRNMREEGALLPTDSVKNALDPIGIILRQKICASSLTETEKDEMLADIGSGLAAIDWEKVAKDANKK